MFLYFCQLSLMVKKLRYSENTNIFLPFMDKIKQYSPYRTFALFFPESLPVSGLMKRIYKGIFQMPEYPLYRPIDKDVKIKVSEKFFARQNIYLYNKWGNIRESGDFIDINVIYSDWPGCADHCVFNLQLFLYKKNGEDLIPRGVQGWLP